MRVLIPIAVFMMLAAVAAAQTPAPTADAGAQPAAPPTGAPPDDPEKLICVRSPPPTGSRMGSTKMCHTRNEWTMIHNQIDRTMERSSPNNTERAPPGGR